MKKTTSASRPVRLVNGARSGTDTCDNTQLLTALMAFKRGDFSARLPEDWTGVPGKIADTFNAVIETNQRMARELERVVHAVGKEGRIGQRAVLGRREVQERLGDSSRG